MNEPQPLFQNPLLEPLQRALTTSVAEVSALIQADPAQHAPRLGVLLAEMQDRLQTLELTRTLDAAEGTCRETHATVLKQLPAEPVREFLLIPFGDVEVERPLAGGSFVFTREHAASAVAWFQRLNRRLAIDYEHQSLERFNTRPDGLRPAAGWIGGLEIRDAGLYATDVTWTERAANLLRTGEYRYFSPVIFWTDEDYSDIAALGPVALTNDPALRSIPELAAGRARHDGNANPEAPAPIDPAPDALLTARREIIDLKTRLAIQEADAFVERGLRLGKVLDSTSMDWRADYLRDPQAAESRLSRTPTILPPGRIVTLDRRGQVAALPAPDDAPRDPTDVEQRDLAAYERASAAGRVRHGH